jgi:hypothetical protein
LNLKREGVIQVVWKKEDRIGKKEIKTPSPEKSRMLEEI